MAWQKKMTLVDFQYMIDACRENPALVPGDEREDAVCNCKDGSDEPPGSCMDIESIISQFKRALQHCEDGGGGDIFFQIFTGGVLIGAGIAGGYWLYKQWKKRRAASLLPIRQEPNGEQQKDGGNKLVGKSHLLTPGEIELRSRAINPADIPLPESVETSMENLTPPTSPVSVDSGTSSCGPASPHTLPKLHADIPPPAPK